MSFRQIMKTFGPNSGFETGLAKIVDDKKWRSEWVVINPRKHWWYIMIRYYWKKDKLYWLKNDLYHLHFEDVKIPRSPTALLRDSITDATQKLICRKLGADDDYQSVLNVQKRRGGLIVRWKMKIFSYFMIVLDTSHLLFYSNGRIQVCNSFKTSLSWVNKKCVNALYKNCVKEFIVSFLPV